MIGERIKERRRILGLSAEALGGKLDVSRDTIYRWESGRRNPSDKDKRKLAEALKTSVAYLMGEMIYSGEPIKSINIKSSDIGAIGNGNVITSYDNEILPLSDEILELIRIFKSFDVRRRTELLNKAFELEEGQNEKILK